MKGSAMKQSFASALLALLFVVALSDRIAADDVKETKSSLESNPTGWTELLADQDPQGGKEAGAWNTYEVTCKGKTITLWINGAVTATWNDCQVRRGYLGLEAEGYYIEFKNLKFKEMTP